MTKARLFIQSYLYNYFFGIVEIYSDNTKIPSTQLINLDYPEFSIIRTFSLVLILSWIFIFHGQDP